MAPISKRPSPRVASAESAPAEERPSPRGEAAWQAARRAVADRNARARKLGKQQREAHDREIAISRRAASDPDPPPQPPRPRA